MNIRQISTVLAALRLLQAQSETLSPDLEDIATNGGAVERMSNEEIDALCEEINAP